MPSLKYSIGLLATLAAHEAIAQRKSDCSWVTPAVPSVPSTTFLMETSSAVLCDQTSDPDCTSPDTITVTAEAFATAAYWCDGTPISMKSADPRTDTTTGLAPASQSAITTSHLSSTGTVSLSTIVSQGSTARRPTTFETSASRPVTDVPNLPSTLTLSLNPTSLLSGPSAHLSSHSRSVHDFSTAATNPSATISTRYMSSISIPPVTLSQPSVVQVTEPVTNAVTTDQTSTTSNSCSQDKAHTNSTLATQTFIIVSQLPDGQIQAGNPHSGNTPAGTVRLPSYSDIAEHPPLWTPKASPSICSRGTMTFECANPTAIPSKFPTKPLAPLITGEATAPSSVMSCHEHPRGL